MKEYVKICVDTYNSLKQHEINFDNLVNENYESIKTSGFYGTHYFKRDKALSLMNNDLDKLNDEIYNLRKKLSKKDSWLKRLKDRL